MIDDTIGAISTPIGAAGIGIIRVSGPKAVEIIDRIFINPKGKKLADARTSSLIYGHIQVNGRNVDEVLVSVMRAPHSFTAEDVVEVNCHGGIVVLKEVLNAVIKAGVRHAEPGEFSKRAFLNGRIDLAQAESIMDLINAKTKKSMHVAVEQLEGKLSKQVSDVRTQLLEILAQIEAGIDFPEHDIEDVSRANIKEKSHLILDKLAVLIESADTGKILREGLKTVIVGKPNVGKSSLLNALLRENRAIVTDIPGTTRDVIEEIVNIKGIPLKLIDTAGIRETEDLVEKMGVERTRHVISEADLVLLVVDVSRPLDEEDMQILRLAETKKLLIIANKTDIGEKINYDELEKVCPSDKIIKTSVTRGAGLDELEDKIEQLVYTGLTSGEDDLFVTNVRHKQALENARTSMDKVIEAIEMDIPTDCLSIDLKIAWESLGEITGDTVGEDLLDEIFSRFCIGK